MFTITFMAGLNYAPVAVATGEAEVESSPSLSHGGKKWQKQKETTRNDSGKRGRGAQPQNLNGVTYVEHRCRSSQIGVFFRDVQTNDTVVVKATRTKKPKPWEMVDDVRKLTPPAAEVLLCFCLTVRN
jgi:hypothetical protein